MKRQAESELHEDRRRQLWIQMAVAMARCDMPMSPANYANAALDAFDKRFATPKDEGQNAEIADKGRGREAKNEA